MKQLFLIAFIFNVLLVKFLYPKDTVEVQTKEVKVEGEKILSSTLTKFFPSSTAILTEPLQFGFNRVTSSLSTMPGVYIRDYGGLGGVKTISVRGLAASNTTILFDGIKINSTQNGLFDLSLIPPNFINKIELLRGGFASFYGNNSAAGVVNLALAGEKENGKIQSSLSSGSFNSYSGGISCNFSVFDKVTHSLGISYLSSSGNYQFTTYQFGEKKDYKRENGGFSNFSTFLSNKIEFDNSLLKANFFFSSARRGVPGAVLQNQIESKRAKLDDRFYFGSLNYLGQIFDSSFISVSIDAKVLSNWFFDPDGIGIITKKETVHFSNNELHSSFNFSHTNKWFKSDILAEWTFSSLTGDMLQPEVGNYVQRFSQAIGLALTKDLLVQQMPIELLASYRFDSYSDFSPYHSFSVGIRADLLPKLLGMRTTFANNFRAPSFNEMYYLNYGTTDLKPERSTAFNVEIYSTYFDYFQPTLNLFYVNTFDKIISIPKSPLQWSARNLGQSISKGFEASVSGKISFVTYNFAYTFQQVLDAQNNSLTKSKQIPYTPRNLLSFNTKLNILKYTYLGVQLFYSGERFALPDNSTNSRLKPYILSDIMISQVLELKSLKFFISFEISNALNTAYEIYKNYPMPGRSFRIEISSAFQ
jgi:outer membrane cobalamin receptor